MALTHRLHIDSLGFRYDTRPVFERFSLTLDPGITWLRGANGKGKTTLLKLMAGSLAPHAGTIHLGKLECRRDALAYRLASFLCGSDLPDLPWLTVQEFLDLHLALYPATDPGRVQVQLTAMGIDNLFSQSLSTLSLGQHRKLQLALALALPLTLLLLDEPFNGLDAAAIDYLRQQLQQRAAAAEACIVLTSHVDPQVPVQRMLDLD